MEDRWLTYFAVGVSMLQAAGIIGLLIVLPIVLGAFRLYQWLN